MKAKRRSLNILLENEQEFEKSLKYLGSGTLAKDAEDFAKRYGGSDEEIKDFMSLVDDVDKSVSNEAEGLVDMFDSLEKYGKADTSDISELVAASNVDEYFDSYIKAVKKAKKKPDSYVKAAEKIRDFLNKNLEKLSSDDIENIKNGRDNFGKTLGLTDGPLLLAISALGMGEKDNPRLLLAKMPWLDKEESSNEAGEAANISNEEIPVDTEASVEDQKKQFDAQLDEFESDMGDFESKLEKAFEENPPPTDDKDSFLKSLDKFGKYHDFLIGRLYGKIGEYAVSKNRKDIVMLASKNVTVLRKWKEALEDSMDDTWTELINNVGEDGMIKSYKPIIKIYDQGTKDLASVIKTVKSNPLKELDAEKLTEGFRNQRNLLSEQRCKEIADFVTSLGD